MKVAGLELGGHKRTAIVLADVFPTERKFFIDKAFVVEEGPDQTIDESLISLLNQPSIAKLGINAPLSLPPCVPCQVSPCPGIRNCEQPSVKWMLEHATSNPIPNPYHLRPLDILIKETWQKKIPFLFDETFGANRGPRAARASYLKKHFKVSVLEVMPRLALASVAPWYGLESREIRLCRDIERGISQRFSILEKLGSPKLKKSPSVFLYEEDISLFSENLLLFDAFWCSLMAFFSELNLLEVAPWQESWGWVAKPRVEEGPEK